MVDLVLRIVSRLLLELDALFAQLLAPSIHVLCYKGYDYSISGVLYIPLAETQVGPTGNPVNPSRTLIQHYR
jgi:hypothetical protein